MELKDALSFLGIDSEKVKTIDDFKSAFSNDFVKKTAIETDEELVNRIYGKKVGTIMTHLKRTEKALGLEYSPEEIKDLSIEDRLEKFGDKLKTKHTQELEELKGANNEEILKTWTSKYDKLKQKNEDTLELLNNLRGENEKLKNDFVVTKKENKISYARENAFNNIKFKKEISEIERKGFEAIVYSKYDFDVDEEEKPYIKDKATGKRIANENKAGEFSTIEDVLLKEATTAKLVQLVPDTTTKKMPVHTNPFKTEAEQSQEPTKIAGRVIKIHPSAEKNAQ